MYVVIISIHLIFIFISYLLGYTLFEGIFILLWLFFLFYFSPLFFLENETSSVENSDYKKMASRFFWAISPKDSLFIPLTLLYIALYGFIFFVFSNMENSISTHAILSIGIFLIFLGYGLGFLWKNQTFFDILEYHTIFGLVSVSIFGLCSFFFSIPSFLPYFFLALFSLWASYFLIQYGEKGNRFLFSSIIVVSIFLLWIGGNLFFSPSIFLFFPLLLLASIWYFEFVSKIHFFHPYTQYIRYFSLLLSFLSIPFFLYFQSSFFGTSLLFLILIIIFYFSIHLRYINYITYTIGLLLIFYIYSLLFSSLFSTGNLLSVFLFIFFLPLLIIGNTYFWEQREKYDFIILHYSSIFFSMIASLYALLFIGWGSNIFLVLFSSIFGVALLFFMSYFRFRNV